MPEAQVARRFPSTQQPACPDLPIEFRLGDRRLSAFPSLEQPEEVAASSLERGCELR
jgi:hypothetical protein